MSQNLHVHSFKWVEETSQFNEDLIKSYSERSKEGYFLEVDIQYPENLHNLHNSLPFLPERMKIEKFENLVANLFNKPEYAIHIRNLKETLNHCLIPKKVWLKSYIDVNTELRMMANNSVFNKKHEKCEKT